MAGIYIHIPFCSSRCIYCDFYSTTFGHDLQSAYVEAVCEELVDRQAELGGQTVQTLYFGGGTPSLLTLPHLETILRTVRQHYTISATPEVTLESNPDDVTETLAQGWHDLGINRVSLGVQTFENRILRLLRRRHDAATACRAVAQLRAAGFDNLTLDLIYGLPGQTFEIWKEDVRRLLDLKVEHLSAYALSYESGTALTKMRDRHEITEADEELVRQIYLHLITETRRAGYEHYEISNFAQPGYCSRHNSSYWDGVPYLGVGPGAHSYNGTDLRRANLPDLKNYIAHRHAVPHTDESLDAVQRFEEYLLTGLRTAKGISLERVKSEFGLKVYHQVQKFAAPHLENRHLCLEGDQMRLTLEGIFISDYIISDLMLAGE